MTHYNPDADDVSFSFPLFRSPNYGPCAQTPGGHLTPALRTEISSAFHSPSFPHSPVSPSSSISADILQDFSLPQIDPDIQLEHIDYEPSGLYGVSSERPSLNDGHLNMPAMPGSIEMRSLPSFHTDSGDTSLSRIDTLKIQIETFAESVRENISHIHHSQLGDARELLRGAFSGLENRITTMMESDAHSMSSPNVRADRYYCQLCVPGRRRVYSTRGAFSRHVKDEHAPQYEYRCPYPGCGWYKYRRDKVHVHLQTIHRCPEQLSRDYVNTLETPMPPPEQCGLCQRRVNGWDEYFKCVCNHCRLPGGSSTETSATQSRRNSDRDGGGYNGQNSPNNGTGGNTGLYPPSSQGDGYDPMGGGYFSGFGQQFDHYGNTHSLGESNLDLGGHTGLNSSRSPSMRPDDDQASISKPVLPALADTPADKSGASGPATLAEYYQSLQSNRDERPTSSGEDDSVKDHKQSSHLKGLMRLTQNHPKKLGRRSINQSARKHPSAEPRGSLIRRCNACGHIKNGCAKCRLPKRVVDGCHFCADKIRQQCEPGTSHDPKECNDHQDLADNDLLDIRLSTWSVSDVISQSSRVFRPEDSGLLKREVSKTCAKTVGYGENFALIRSHGSPTWEQSMAIIGGSPGSDYLSVFAANCPSSSSGVSHFSNTQTATYTQIPKALLQKMAVQSIDYSYDGLNGKFRYFKPGICPTPSLNGTSLTLRKKSSMLRTRVQVIVEILKLRTSVINIVKSEVKDLARLGIKPEHCDSLQVDFDLSIFDLQWLLPQLLDMIARNARLLGDLTSTGAGASNFDAKDHVHLMMTMLVHIMVIFFGHPIRSTKAMLIE